MLSPDGDVLKLYSIRESNDLTAALFDTQNIREAGKGNKKLAYVWTPDDLIFVAPHQATVFHHSSFTSGKKVRCSGMIGGKDGKVIHVDNNSGHYLPSTNHLHSFVEMLASRRVFHADAIVMDETQKVGADGMQSLRTSVADFLHGHSGVRQQKIYDRYRLKTATLRELVEERFQLMRAAGGAGVPDNQVWARAYVSICNDFGKFDPSFLRKAQAPPIPRTKARRRV